MQGLTKFDAIYVALVFIVPGYVFLSLHCRFVVGQRKPAKDQILSFLTLSSLNFALFGWIIYLAYTYDLSIPLKAASWIFVTVVIPAAAGIYWGTANQHGRVLALYRRFGLEPIHHIPTAWDYKFSTSVSAWVLVTLKNGTQFAGLWINNSFASDDPKERDLLIERIYEIRGSAKPWKPTEKSLLIAAGEISTIEFTTIEDT